MYSDSDDQLDPLLKETSATSSKSTKRSKNPNPNYMISIESEKPQNSKKSRNNTRNSHAASKQTPMSSLETEKSHKRKKDKEILDPSRENKVVASFDTEWSHKRNKNYNTSSNKRHEVSTKYEEKRDPTRPCVDLNPQHAIDLTRAEPSKLMRRAATVENLFGLNLDADDKVIVDENVEKVKDLTSRNANSKFSKDRRGSLFFEKQGSYPVQRRGSKTKDELPVFQHSASSTGVFQHSSSSKKDRKLKKQASDEITGANSGSTSAKPPGLQRNFSLQFGQGHSSSSTGMYPSLFSPKNQNVQASGTLEMMLQSHKQQQIAGNRFQAADTRQEIEIPAAHSSLLRVDSLTSGNSGEKSSSTRKNKTGSKRGSMLFEKNELKNKVLTGSTSNAAKFAPRKRTSQTSIVSKHSVLSKKSDFSTTSQNVHPFAENYGQQMSSVDSRKPVKRNIKKAGHAQNNQKSAISPQHLKNFNIVSSVVPQHSKSGVNYVYNSDEDSDSEIERNKSPRAKKRKEQQKRKKEHKSQLDSLSKNQNPSYAIAQQMRQSPSPTSPDARADKYFRKMEYSTGKKGGRDASKTPKKDKHAQSSKKLDRKKSKSDHRLDYSAKEACLIGNDDFYPAAFGRPSITSVNMQEEKDGKVSAPLIKTISAATNASANSNPQNVITSSAIGSVRSQNFVEHGTPQLILPSSSSATHATPPSGKMSHLKIGRHSPNGIRSPNFKQGNSLDPFSPHSGSSPRLSPRNLSPRHSIL